MEQGDGALPLTFLQAGGGQHKVPQSHGLLLGSAAVHPRREITGMEHCSSAIQVLQALMYAGKEKGQFLKVSTTTSQTEGALAPMSLESALVFCYLLHVSGFFCFFVFLFFLWLLPRLPHSPGMVPTLLQTPGFCIRSVPLPPFTQLQVSFISWFCAEVLHSTKSRWALFLLV